MVSSFWGGLKEVFCLSRSERLFLVAAMLSGFCISMEYAVVRPVSNALFITAYGTACMPYAWLAVIPANLLLVALYNRFLPRLGCQKMVALSLALIGAGSLASAFFLQKVFALPFIFYVWKEIYVMFMFQQLWAVIHSNVSLGKAKFLYGFLFAAGGLGGTLGSLFPGFYAEALGSENLLFATLPIYAVLGLSFALLFRTSSPTLSEGLEGKSSLLEGFRLVKKSRLLTFILVIVLLMQLTSSLVYYQFNTALEAAVGDKDLRTEYGGKVLSIVNGATVGLQLFVAPLFIHALGLSRAHLAIPLALGLNSLLALFIPTFGFFSYTYVSIKACDFSLFGVIKEMLYVPLSKREKFQAKAVIDVFAYRSAKALASLLILFLQFAAASTLSLSLVNLLLFGGWMLAVKTLYLEVDRPLETV